MDEREQTIDGDDVEGHRLAANDNEVVVRRPVTDVDEDDDDVEGHKLAANDNEIVVGRTDLPRAGATPG